MVSSSVRCQCNTLRHERCVGFVYKSFKTNRLASVLPVSHLVECTYRRNYDSSFQSQYKSKEGAQEESQIHKIRITLTSRNVKSLEKGMWKFKYTVRSF